MLCWEAFADEPRASLGLPGRCRCNGIESGVGEPVGEGSFCESRLKDDMNDITTYEAISLDATPAATGAHADTHTSIATTHDGG